MAAFGICCTCCLSSFLCHVLVTVQYLISVSLDDSYSVHGMLRLVRVVLLMYVSLHAECSMSSTLCIVLCLGSSLASLVRRLRLSWSCALSRYLSLFICCSLSISFVSPLDCMLWQSLSSTQSVSVHLLYPSALTVCFQRWLHRSMHLSLMLRHSLCTRFARCSFVPILVALYLYSFCLSPAIAVLSYLAESH